MVVRPEPAKVDSRELRSRFARRLSDLYGAEVPAYNTLVDVSQEVNRQVLNRNGADAERLGSIDRVTDERHGAIRVRSSRELAQVARVFGAMGMHPCGFYDLRDAAPNPVPVVSTAFRPLDPDELAANPFRVFTSVLVPEDRRFFDAGLERRLTNFLDRRDLFPVELLDLADRAIAHGELPAANADRFLDLAVGSFALLSYPVDRAWYAELNRISSVDADIGGVTTTHINHLTPRVLDIDELYRSMQVREIDMIDAIQGPPRWDGPDVLLRRTSFRALAEPRHFREPDGTVSTGDLRVRFGEVQSRGIALTPTGRDHYEALVATVDGILASYPRRARADVARKVWSDSMPSTEHELCLRGLGFFTFHATEDAEGMPAERRRAALESGDLGGLVDAGVVRPCPIVYEDFLPRSVAGIFAFNLAGRGRADAEWGGAERDADWIAEAIGRPVGVPEDVYATQVDASVATLERSLGRTVRRGTESAHQRDW